MQLRRLFGVYAARLRLGRRGGASFIEALDRHGLSHAPHMSLGAKNPRIPKWFFGSLNEALQKRGSVSIINAVSLLFAFFAARLRLG